MVAKRTGKSKPARRPAAAFRGSVAAARGGARVVRTRPFAYPSAARFATAR